MTGHYKYTISKPDDNIEKIAKTNTGKVLDVGIGDGSNLKQFKELGFDVYGIDVSDAAIRRMEKEVPEGHLKDVDLMAEQEIPFPDNFFDVVFARLVMHYLNDEQAEFVLDEFDRILKPNGLLFISVKVANVGNIETGKKMRTQEEWNKLISGCFEVKEIKQLVKKPYDYDPAPSNMLEIFAKPID